MLELLSGPWGPILIFFLRMVDVSMSTFRVLMVVRGSRLLAPVVSFFEILVWVVAAGAVIQNLGSVWHAVGYAAGFAAGTAIGMWIEGKLALGICSIRVISRGSQRDLARELRASGYGVTEQHGRGREGIVGVLYAVVRRRDIHDVVRTIERHDPDAFVTIQNDASIHRGWLYRVKRK